jgi:hypothetical protein
MENKYELNEKILSMSSAIEDAPYLFMKGVKTSYIAEAGKSATCQCRSSRSSGGTCRALSLESKT